MTADTLTREYVETRTTDQPADASHIVHMPETETQTPQSYVLQARIEGFPITALCGYTWVPHKNPEPLPVCSTCLEIYQHDPNGHGDRGDLPDA